MRYRGIVDIEFSKNGIVVGHVSNHNSGTARLQWLFAKALSGNSISGNVPGYIDVTIDGVSILKKFIPITGLSYYDKIGDDDIWNCRLNALISNKDLLNGITTTSLADCTFCLYDKTQGYKLAETAFSDDEDFTNINGMQLNLSWKLYIDIGDNA